MKSNKLSNNIKFYIFLEVLRKYSHINQHLEISKENISEKINSGHIILPLKEINEKIRKEIKERMNIDFEQEIDRRTIYQYVKDLNDLGLEVTTHKDNNMGYALITKDIEPYELKLLVDSISANIFITKKKTKELVKKLSNLQHNYADYDLKKQVFIDDRSKSKNEEILYSIDYIHKAINEGKKISFNYYDYNYKKELVYRTEKNSHNIRTYVATPVGLILKEDYYYVVVNHDKYDDLTNYRVDRMKKVSVLEEDGKSLKDINGCEEGHFNSAIYSKQNFKMFSGKDCEVILQIKKGLINLVIDELGEDVELHKINEDTFQARFCAKLGMGLTKWVLQLGPHANVISPLELREDVRLNLEEMIK